MGYVALGRMLQYCEPPDSCMNHGFRVWCYLEVPILSQYMTSWVVLRCLPGVIFRGIVVPSHYIIYVFLRFAMVHDSVNDKPFPIRFPDSFAWRVSFWEFGDYCSLSRDCESYANHGA